ncbi:MAG: glycosyl transferase family 1, partial [Bacteroidales bacterium]|nr:glycosyl transferase family 1 [Candidatus Colimorpha onthohippi]
ALLETWASEHANVQSTAGRQSFAEELQLIASLDVMISMDSANMHFASCMEVPVVSIWGATDAVCGFYGWRQDPQHAIATNHKCRPCSIYGNKPCQYGDYRCMTYLDVADIARHVFTMLEVKPME